MNSDITSEQRLRRVEILLETAAAKIHDNSIAIDRLTERTTSNAVAIDRLTERTKSNAEAIDRLTERTTSNAEALDRLTERTNSNAEAIDRLVEQDLNLTIKIAELMDVFAETLPIIRRQQVNIEEMQAEVRGLQVENRRILARVFGEES
jgi:chromosome segregation ATPase